MAIKTLLLLFSFFFFSGGALFVPMIGVVGYVLHYHCWPDNQWWGRELSDWGLRYAFTIGLCLLIGTLLNKHKLKLGTQVMKAHEWLLVLFWATAMVSMGAGADLSLYPADQLYQAMLLDKLSKVVLFCLLMSHVVTTPKRFDILLWTMILGTLYTGYQAWDAPPWRFLRARLDGIGGPDFRESSFLGAHFAMMLPLIGIQFLRGGWFAKGLCVLTGMLTVNGLVLTRTRAAFVGACVGIVAAMLFSLKGRRRRILLYLLPGLLSAAYLTDPGFWTRMKTVRTDAVEQDRSAFTRLLLWEAAGRMIMDYPMGVGVGNFKREIGNYDSRLIRRDAHNTFVRCAAELGIAGIGLMALLVVSAFICLRQARYLAWRCTDSWQLRYYSYGLAVTVLIMLSCGLFMTQLYIEEFWWLLTLPVCLLRASEFEYARSRATEPTLESEEDQDPNWALPHHPVQGDLGLI
ncbi:MAG: O-antigen ligase family protein [Phycisphaerae bacterium]